MGKHNIIRQFLRAVLHELFRSKKSYNFLASMLLLGMVAIGYFWQETYRSTGTLIVKTTPLTESGSANIDARMIIAELIERGTSRTFLNQLAAKLDQSLMQKADWQLGDIVTVENFSFIPQGNRLKIIFTAPSPALAEATLSLMLVELQNSISNRAELEQFDARYAELSEEEIRLKSALDETAQALETILVAIPGGAAGDASERIVSVRSAIQDVEVNLSAVNAKIERIAKQLKKEETLHAARQELEALESQKTKAQQNIEQAESTYGPGSPELVSLQQELDNINVQIVSLRAAFALFPSDSSDSLYERLRQQLALEEVEKESLVSRRQSLEEILAKETSNASVSSAQSAKINRLEREIKALEQEYLTTIDRRQKVLDQKLETQQKQPEVFVAEPPLLPSTYIGMGLFEFLVLGPLMAFGLPFFIASAVVLGDSRIRTSRRLKGNLPPTVPVMAVVPHYNSPKTMRLFRRAILGLFAWGALIFMLYFTVGIIGLKG